MGALRRSHDQELVRPEAADDRRLGQLAAQQPTDLEQDRVAGRVAVRVVEQPEVVHVDQGQADPPGARVPGAVDLRAEHLDDRAVVEQAGQGVLLRGLHEQVRLAVRPPRGGTEDEIEHAGHRHCGRADQGQAGGEDQQQETRRAGA